MFLNEYYFGYSPLITVFRFIGGPIIFYFGLNMYTNAMDRFGIGYGGIMIAFSIYYTLKPAWWLLVHWGNYKTIKFQMNATEDMLILKEDESESKTAYSKFEKILKRRNHFSLMVKKGLKIYLPIDKLSEKTIRNLTNNLKK